jgi:adenylosuccinate synthase
MPLDIIIGAQWGDEGKGRITDLLASQAHLVARFAGGDNAGHTVTVGDQIFKLHLLPSGIIQPDALCALGSGMVINPQKLVQEMNQLEALGIDVSPQRLKISTSAHIITPAHRALDEAQEKARGGPGLGTTRRGIGPAYTDKSARDGIRAGSMQNPETFTESVRHHLQQTQKTLYDSFEWDPAFTEQDIEDYRICAERLRAHLSDVSKDVHQALLQGKNVLAEGAQGTLLDLDHGTYPYVTSSHPTTAGALLGLGVGLSHVRRIIGVTKAYQTRVGEGPFPTEVHGDLADRIRGSGDQPWHEFGTTTGRPRRVGWLDLVLLRYANRINGFTEVALTKLDILSGLTDLMICDAYTLNGSRVEDPPSVMEVLDLAKPTYQPLPGWVEDLTEFDAWEELPPPAKQYIERIETEVGIPVRSISVGPERHQVIQKDL